VPLQQSFDTPAKGGVGGANLVQEGRALGRIFLFQSFDEDGLFLHAGSFSAIGVSGSTYPCDIWPRTAHEIREKPWRGRNRSRYSFRRYAFPLSDDVYVLWSDDPAEWAPMNHSCDPNMEYAARN
jgi:hypothetical protein